MNAIKKTIFKIIKIKFLKTKLLYKNALLQLKHNTIMLINCIYKNYLLFFYQLKIN